MKMLKKSLALLLALVMVLSCVAGVSAETRTAPERPAQTQRENVSEQHTQQEPQYADDDEVTVIVMMEGEPTVSAASGVSLFASAESNLLNEHKKLETNMASEGIDYEVNREFTTLLNAVSVTVAYGDVKAIAEIPGVESVHIDRDYVRIEDEQQSEDAPQTNNANELTGVASLLDNNYDGTGMVIAVLDSGITPEHEVFNTMPNDPAITEDDANDLIEALGYGRYLNAKIPYYHDYYETIRNKKSSDEADYKSEFGYDAGGHGTHVSGIAAGYAVNEEGEVTFSGAAPQAQILMMKIFADDTSKTSTGATVYFSALEDAYKLGADVVNMSIGSYNAFAYDDDLENVLHNVYERLEGEGVLVCASAGNYYSVGSLYGYLEDGSTYSSYNDYGTICTPAIYPGVFAVGAAENSAYIADTVMKLNGTEDVPYVNETTEDNSKDGYTFEDLQTELNGESLDYVVIPNLGYEWDYEGLDVEGKIAVVKRGADSNYFEGVFRFATKIQIAAEKGARAVILYNNVSGDLLMDLSPDLYEIPAITISKETYDQFFAGAQTGTVSFPEESAEIVNADAGRMVDMSCWGATPSLTIGPEIAAVGGHIRSALAYSTDEYVVYSGTSMASPNMAGALATLMQYLRENGYGKVGSAAAVKPLVESTAMILEDENGVPYSPRKQGAGLYNIQYATEAEAYIESPLVNLGDDPARSGQFVVSFTIKNTTTESQTYELSNVGVQTDYGYFWNGVGYNEVEGMLIDDSTITTNLNNNRVTVSPRGTATVNVTIQLSQDTMNWIEELYTNGIYVEGFITLTNVDSDSEIHATYMGYYGDWTDAPILEQYDWRAYYTGDGEYNSPQMYYTYGNWAFAEDLKTWNSYTDGGENFYYYAWGYDYGDNWNFNEDRFAFPAKGMGNYAYLNGIYVLPYTLRNARHLVMVVSDAATDEVYYVDDTEYVVKSWYDYTGGWYAEATYQYDGTDLDGNPLPSNTKVKVEFYANLAYGPDVLGDVDWTTADRSAYSDYLEWDFTCTVDNDAPQVLDCIYDAETGLLKIVASDNQYVANIEADYWTEGKRGYQWTDYVYQLFYGEAGEEATAIFDISSFVESAGEWDYMAIYANDYATNADLDEIWFYLNSEANDEYGIDVNGHTVTFDYNDGSETVFDMVHDGDAIEAPADPTREGYTFAGWYLDGELYDFETPVTGNFTLVAEWTEDTDEPTPVDPVNPDNPDKPTPVKPSKPSTGTTTTPVAAEPEIPFTDVSENASYYDAVKYVYEEDLMNGTSETKFAPNSTLTRGMVATILYRIEGNPAATYAGSFADVADGVWYTDGVEWAAEAGVVNGYTNGNFGPEDPVTREQLAAMLYRYAEYKGYDVTARADLADYTDSANISAYAIENVQWALAEGILLDANGAIDNAIRAEVAVAVAAFHQTFVK